MSHVSPLGPASRPQAPAGSPGLLGAGDAGPAVRALQARLTALGFSTGGVDGRFGPETDAAVRAFQQARGLAVDGLVGPLTRQALAAAPERPAAAAMDLRSTWTPSSRRAARSVNQAPALARRDMANLLAEARAGSAGRRPDGYCYMHVWRFIERAGYGHMPSQGIPDSHATYAKQFASYADAHLQSLGLRKLALDNPYDAPAGAIVVVRPGTPGTAHPTAGDIAVADGQGRFFNGGEMGYGGRASFPPGNRHVLGIYVPA